MKKYLMKLLSFAATVLASANAFAPAARTSFGNTGEYTIHSKA